MNFRRATTKDISEGRKLFVGAPGVIRIPDDGWAKFFDENGFEAEERSLVEEAKAAGRIVAPYIISDETEDRHGDSIKLSGWQLENYNGAVLLNHGKAGFGAIRETILPVAEAPKVWQYGKQLKSVGVFAHKDVYPFGHMVGEMVMAGLIKGSSVGFLPKEWEINEERSEKNGRISYDFFKQELTEWSVVSVGSNRNALVQLSHAAEGAKEMDIDTEPVVEMAEKVLDQEPEDEDIAEWAEKLFFDHKTGMNFAGS